MSLQTQLASLITAIGADIKALQAASGSSGTKVSALTSATTPDGTETIPVVQGGVSKKMALSLLGFRFAGKRPSVLNASVTSQGPGFAADTYLAGSDVTIPSGSLQAGAMYRCWFNVTKTAAGVATPIINLRIGTAGTTADASRGAFTFSAQTAVADEGMFEVYVTFRTVGSGTSAVVQSLARLTHRLSITGLGTGVSEPEVATSAGFDSTVAGLKVGLSVNGGASAAWTVNLVQAELLNLVG